jgi:hypothetical protein
MNSHYTEHHNVTLPEATVSQLVSCLLERSHKAPRIIWREEVISLYTTCLKAQKLTEKAVTFNTLDDSNTLKASLMVLIPELLRHPEHELRRGGLSTVDSLLSQHNRDDRGIMYKWLQDTQYQQHTLPAQCGSGSLL